MPQSYVTWGCTERKGSAIGFYRFPACPNRRSAWTDAVKRMNWTPSDEDRQCGKHFLALAPTSVPDHPDYVPSIFAFKRPERVDRVGKYERAKRRQNDLARVPAVPALPGVPAVTLSNSPSTAEAKQAIMPEASPAQDRHTLSPTGIELGHTPEASPASEPGAQATTAEKEQGIMPEASTAQEHHEPGMQPFNKHTAENSAQTDVVVAVPCFICSSKFEALQKEVLHLKHKEAKLLSDNAVLLRSMEVRPVTTCSSDQLTESSVQFYTGLPSLALFALIVQFMQEGTKYLPSTVSLGDAVLMVLAEFRLALLNRDLAFRFNVSEGTVAHIIFNLIPLLATIFSKFIIWPTRPDIARTMPTFVHRHYPRCRVIVDCSECRIQRPLSFTARSQTYSH
ncbi:unnamed protein product [Ixodes persulcatus]